MNARKMLITLTTIVMIVALFIGTISGSAVQADDNGLPAVVKLNLDNVRDYAPAISATGLSYGVDAGYLYAGQPGDWHKVSTPAGVIVNTVALDARNADTIYMGAANELAVYRSTDNGASWLRAPLTEDAIGGVSDIAVDAFQRLLYVGTDTAGLFRLRDVGSSLIVGGHLTLDEPVLEVAADSGGQGMAFARTAGSLYRAESFGMAWSKVDSLSSTPTALAIADTAPATVYVGTVDRGLLKSKDGLAWMNANDGLGQTAGSRLQVDALAIDPQRPNVLYVATSFWFGSTTLHQTPVGVAMSVNHGKSWTQVQAMQDMPVASLLPVSGQTGAVYALTLRSRTPLAMGAALQVVTDATASASSSAAGAMPGAGSMIPWLVAMAAALILTVLVATDIRRSTIGRTMQVTH